MKIINPEAVLALYRGMRGKALAVAVLLSAASTARSTDREFAEYTPQSEAAIDQGTKWLVQALNPDGGCGVDITQPSDIGCTAMAGLAFLSQGSTPTRGSRTKEANRILNFILKAVDEMPPDDITCLTGTQIQNKIGRHAHTFFAAVYLSQIVGEVNNPERAQKALRKLIYVTQRTQQPDGGWGDGSWAPVLGTVMAWMGLRGGYFAGARVEASIEQTEEKLLKQMKEEAQGWMHSLYKNASGVRVLYATGRGGGAVARKTLEEILRLVTTDKTPFTQAGGEEYLAFHLINECMLQEGGRDWQKWFPCVRERLIEAQNKDGSWTGHHCITSRTFCTAASLLVLTSPNRYLPISQK